MAKAEISIHGKRYVFACADGEEQRLMTLGERLNARITDLATAMGGIGAERLFLAAALSLVDELDEAQSQVQSAERKDQNNEVEAAAVEALLKAASRIQQMASRISAPS